MSASHWQNEINISITVCDKEGIITAMNSGSCENFAKWGGEKLIGKNLLDCHPEQAKNKILAMLENPHLNCYTTEKEGKKNFIYQAPLFKDGEFTGLVEMIIPIPNEMPHHIRK